MFFVIELNKYNNKNMKENNQKQLRELFNVLPEELKDAIFSEKTADVIFNICKKHQVKGDKRSKIAKLVGDSLMGLLSPDKLEGVIKAEINVEQAEAEKIALEINRFILYPVKEALHSLYEIEFTPRGKIIKSKIEKSKIVEKEAKDTSNKDTYRESIN